MINKIKLITTPACPKCPDAKKLLKEANISFNEFSIDDEDTMALAIKLKIMIAPTIILEDDETYISGLSEIKKYIKSLEDAE